MTFLSWISGLLQALVLVLMPVAPIFQPSDENFSRYHKAVIRVMRRVVHHVFMLLRPANNLTPKQLLFALPNYSNKEYKKLSNFVRDMLDNNHPTEDYDITLLYMLLQKVCGLSDQWTTPGTLENDLKLMKDKRNEIAHQDLALTRLELERRVKELKDLSRQVLLKTSQKIGQPVQDKIIEMENGMDEALSAVDMWEPYKQGLTDLRQQQCNIIIREGKKEMKNLLQKLHILNPFSWLLDADFSKHTIGYVFTELSFCNQNIVNMKDLLITELPSGELPETILISGTPGMGKTSLMRFILHDWLSDVPVLQGLDTYSLVLPVEARYVLSVDVCELVKHELLPNTCQQLHHEDIVSTLQELSLMWLLDGYDEASHTTKQLIKEILRKFPKSKVIITMRTECVNEVKLVADNLHRSQLLFENRGFSMNNINACAEKLFTIYIPNGEEQKGSQERFLSFLRRQDYGMQEIYKVPLFLTILAVLWIESPDIISGVSTSTRVFQLLFDHILNKMITREPFQKLCLRKQILKRKLESFFDTLGCIISSQVSVWVMEDYCVEWLEESCEELGLPFEETMSPFFTLTVESSTNKIKERYFTNHRTVLEFLVARTFCRRMISEGWDVFTTIQEFNKMAWLRIKKLPKLPKIYTELRKDLASYQLIMKHYEITEDLKIEYEFHGYKDSYAIICSRDESQEKLYKSLNFLKLHIGSYSMNFVSGYLKVQQELTPVRAKQICYIHSIDNTSEEEWLQLITETEEDQTLLKELLPLLTSFRWNIKHHNSHVILKLLEYCTPQTLLLQCSNEADVQYVQENIKKFSILHSEINLHFDNRYYQEKHETAGVLESLSTIFADNAECFLTTLCCPVDSVCLDILRKACHLQELVVKIKTLEDTKLLAEISSELPQLKYLEILFDPVIMAAEPKDLPTFNVFQPKVKGKLKQTKTIIKSIPSEDTLSLSLLTFYSLKWGLPSGHCNRDCTKRVPSYHCIKCYHSPDSLLCQKKKNHFSARRWHRRCIYSLKQLNIIMTKILNVINNDETRNFNPFVRINDKDGTWKCHLFLQVTRKLLHDHKSSITVHNRLLKFTHRFRDKKTTVPIKLVFPKAFSMDPVKLGASVAKLCPNPYQVVLTSSNPQLNTLQTFLWIYYSLSKVDKIMWIDFAKDERLHNYQEYYRNMFLLHKIAPSINIHRYLFCGPEAENYF